MVLFAIGLVWQKVTGFSILLWTAMTVSMTIVVTLSERVGLNRKNGWRDILMFFDRSHYLIISTIVPVILSYLGCPTNPCFARHLWYLLPLLHFLIGFASVNSDRWLRFRETLLISEARKDYLLLFEDCSIVFCLKVSYLPFVCTELPLSPSPLLFVGPNTFRGNHKTCKRGKLPSREEKASGRLGFFFFLSRLKCLFFSCPSRRSTSRLSKASADKKGNTDR